MLPCQLSDGQAVGLNLELLQIHHCEVLKITEDAEILRLELLKGARGLTVTHLIYTVALRSPDIDHPAPVGLEWAAVLLKGASSTL